MKLRCVGILACLLMLLTYVHVSAPPEAAAANGTDVIVYGGTPAGVAAAIAASEHRADVILVAEGPTVGGMMSNGISASDIGADQTVQGIARTFFKEVRRYYRDSDTWRFEPRIAERIFLRLLRNAGVEVRLNTPLDTVTVQGRRIKCLVFVRGKNLCARNYVDASYTGDLVAAAKVPHRLGPADMLSYNEGMAQRRRWQPVLTVPPSQRAAATAAFKNISYVDVDNTFRTSETFEKGAPSLAYRLCVTTKPGNKTPFRPAANYKDLAPAFRYLMRAVDPSVEKKGNGTLMSDVFHLAVLPGNKYDLNAGLQSFTNMPAPDGYFTDYTTRMQHNEDLRNYVQSFFYFIQKDPSVPRPVQNTFRRFGLCADEFVKNGNWPYEPYVREARRILGRDKVTVHDIFMSRTKSDSVALGAYNIDTKLSRLVFKNGTLYRDFGMHSRAPVFEIPFRAMVPRQGSVTNLLAPVGVASSPTAYGTIRMEPQYMALGEAAGVATALAEKARISVAAVSPARVQSVLRYRGVIHKATDACRSMSAHRKRWFGFTASCGVKPVNWR